jgi:hypothetical protein
MDDELAALMGLFNETQQTKSAARLSERNVIELVRARCPNPAGPQTACAPRGSVHCDCPSRPRRARRRARPCWGLRCASPQPLPMRPSGYTDVDG